MKNKKLTYKELANYVVNMEVKFNHALNTIGKTLTDFIEFKGDKDKFIEFLKEKYKEKDNVKETEASP